MTHFGRIKIVKESADLMDNIVICPHCGKETRFGSLVMYSGQNGCSECIRELHDAVDNDRAKHYDAYVRKANNHDYEPYRYKEE